MSKAICVMGESGSGKTTSLEGLDPKTTYYINCDFKEPPWKKWRSRYGEDKKNYIATADLSKVINLMQNVDKSAPHVKTLVIETLNTAMNEKEINELGDSQGFNKWNDMAKYGWNICKAASMLRTDLTVIIGMHSETVRDDFGYSFTRIRTNGRKLEKVVLESLFNIVLLAKAKDDGTYVFETKPKQSTAKTPRGMFDSDEIPNDMTLVLKALEDF